MQVQTIFCNQIQYCVFRTSVRARILKFLSKPSPTPIYYPQVFASALSRNTPGTAIAIPRDSRAHPLARWFAGIRPTCHARPSEPGPTLSCNSPCTPIAFLPAYRAYRSRDGIDLCPSSDPNPSGQHSRAYRLARWFAGGRIPSRNLRSRIRGVLQKSQALHLIKIRAGVCASHYALEGLRTLIFRIILY